MHILDPYNIHWQIFSRSSSNCGVPSKSIEHEVGQHALATNEVLLQSEVRDHILFLEFAAGWLTKFSIRSENLNCKNAQY